MQLYTIDESFELTPLGNFSKIIRMTHLPVSSIYETQNKES